MTSEDQLSVGVNAEVEEHDYSEDPSMNFDFEEELYENVKTLIEADDSIEKAPIQCPGGPFKTESIMNNTEMEEWRIMLLGKRGAGKSSTGNTILGWQAFNTDMQLARVTQFCEKRTGNINGRAVAVIDTPGLKRIKDMEKEIIREIQKSVSLYRPGPHAFVMVLPVGNLSGEDLNINKLIENKFGKRIWNYTIILFTHGDRLEGKTLNDVIASSDQDLRDFIRKCSGGFLVFNNKDLGSQEQVTQLLEKIETLVAINGRGCYTSALYPASERKIRERQEEIIKAREEEIARKERELEENHDDDKLERKKRELWREVEEDARKEAENPPRRKLSNHNTKGSIFKL